MQSWIRSVMHLVGEGNGGKVSSDGSMRDSRVGKVDKEKAEVV